MKLYYIPFLMLVMSCEAQKTESVNYGTFFALANNTLGVNDFKIAKPGNYAVSFGAMDFGRNIYRNSSNTSDYTDVIGILKFQEEGIGYIELANQDSIILHTGFSYSFGKKTQKGVEMVIKFDHELWTTYSSQEPLSVFNYIKIGPSVWKYSEYMDRYSGNYLWVGNKILFSSKINN